MKKERAVEYKETFVLDGFPKIEYSRQQLRRFLTFHGYARNIAKMVRYAAHFDYPDRICLVYIVGQPKRSKIESLFAETGCSDRLCVLTSDFPDAAMDLYERFDAMRTQLKSAGLWDTEGNKPSDAWFRAAENNAEQYKCFPEELESFVKLDREHIELLHAYEEMKRQAENEWFSHFTCYRSGHEPSTLYLRGEPDPDRRKLTSGAADQTDRRIADLAERGATEREIAARIGTMSNVAVHKRIVKMRDAVRQKEPATLDDLVLSVYPRGVEALSLNPFASVSIAGIKAGVDYGMNGSCDKRLGFSLDDHASVIRDIRNFIKSRIQACGYCEINELRDYLQLPPFGFWNGGYISACLSRALRDFPYSTLFYYDGVCSFLVKKHIQAVVSAVFWEGFRNKQKCRCLYLESHAHKVVKRFSANLFGVKVPLCGMDLALLVSKELRASRRLPLSVVDERLLILSLWNVRWYDRAEVESLASVVTENEDSIKASYLRYLEEDRRIPQEKRRVLPEYAFCWSREMCNKEMFCREENHDLS